MPGISDSTAVDQLLAALGEQLAAATATAELVVIGGSGLLALGVVERPTRDIDVIALGGPGGLRTARPLPDDLVAAAARVAADFSLVADWINPGPTALLDLGLPAGFVDRVHSRAYGAALRVHFAGRLDQIHFKLYAAVDQGPGKHEADLRALEPRADELIAAARWARTHDPSAGFRAELEKLLGALGVEDARLEP